jgi:hypothetical protein
MSLSNWKGQPHYLRFYLSTSYTKKLSNEWPKSLEALQLGIDRGRERIDIEHREKALAVGSKSYDNSCIVLIFVFFHSIGSTLRLVQQLSRYAQVPLEHFFPNMSLP